LHYYARRFYDDVLISPFLHGAKVDVYVVSDKLQPLSGNIHVRLLDSSGKVLLDKTEDISMPAQSSAIYLSLEKTELSAKADPRQSLLVVDLEMAGKRVSRNLVFFDVTHNLELPATPKIESSFSKTGEGYSLKLQSEKLARNVALSFGELDVQISDNYFDLLPGEPVRVDLKSSATLDQLRNALKISP
jgi:beta-mannosidase